MKLLNSVLLVSSGLCLHYKTESPGQVEGPLALLSTGHRTADNQPPQDTALQYNIFIDLPGVMPKAVIAHRAACSKVPAGRR